MLRFEINFTFLTIFLQFGSHFTNLNEKLIKSIDSINWIGCRSTFIVAIEEASYVAVLRLDGGAELFLFLLTTSLSSPLSTGDSWRQSGSISWVRERKLWKLFSKRLIDYLSTSISTCTTPVDLRLGRLRRWIIAWVVWPLRLSFSLSFSVEFVSLINLLDLQGLKDISLRTFIVIRSIRRNRRFILGWVLSSWSCWYNRSFERILRCSVSRWSWRLWRIAGSGCWCRFFDFELELNILDEHLIDDRLGSLN